VIINIPSAESLNEIALRLHFSAWSSLVDIRFDFDRAFEPSSDPFGSEWSDEWEAYLVACQSELQSICTLIQQSNELALRAKICSVSPFLLLVGSDRKFSSTPKDVDFSEFRTVDAVELPGAVNTLCSDQLSDKFIQSYNEIRSLRNKIAHLGYLSRQFSPEELLHILVAQYIELWNGRKWLNDRVRFAAQTRLAFFHDESHSSVENEVMYELPYDLRIFNNSEFKQLFEHAKQSKRYLCHYCIASATTQYTTLEDLCECETSFLEKKSKTLHCMMCGRDFRVSQKLCEECGGNVIGDNGDEYVGRCHCCGVPGVENLSGRMGRR
jgi:hypothetical protein